MIAYYDIRDKEPQYAIMEAIKQSVPEESFIVWEVSQFGYYSRTHYQVNHPKTYMDSEYSFNLGFGFPTALGAKVGALDRPVLCISGDGGFMFNSSELATAVKYGINVTTIVFRDDAYGNVARDMGRFLWRNVRDGSAEPGPGQVRRVIRHRRDADRGPDGSGERCFRLALELESPVIMSTYRCGHMAAATRQAACYIMPFEYLGHVPQDGLIPS